MVLRLPAVLLALGLATAASAAMQQAPCDYMTGGGNLAGDRGERAAFSIAAGCRNGVLVGHVAFRDADAAIQFRSSALTAYLADPAQPELREICGIGRVAGADEPVVFRARVYDYADPGRVDKFGIVIEDFRFMPREVRNPGGGNVQRHADDGSMAPPVDVELMCGGLDPP